MQSKLIKHDTEIFRILDTNNDFVFAISCSKQTMPKWISRESIDGYADCTEDELLNIKNVAFRSIESLNMDEQRLMNVRFNVIAEILPYASDSRMRNQKITEAAVIHNMSKQTVRKYLCLYLVYQNKAVFAPKEKKNKAELSQDEKNMRWALNKFFYTKNKNSLRTAYTFMLRGKYCGADGQLYEKYPSFYQFRYFYRKTKNYQRYYISRDGMKNYQKNKRPLLGDGVQAFAGTIGKGMLDSTICDIYLVSDTGDVAGRPVLTACIDIYSGLCCGYALSWEGGMYSIRRLMMNITADKVEHCKSFGIEIKRDDWNCDRLPLTFVTDMGSEYKSENLEQLSELGITIINLPSYRPELKGGVEKFFDIIQNLFKPYLKGKGVIEPDFRERGAHDYRKDACLTIREFEKIIVYCIVYYNSERLLKNFPFTEEMLCNNLQPYSSSVWNWCLNKGTANLTEVNVRQLILTMLPRIQGRFTRFGLKVGRLHYKRDGYTEKYLSKETVTAVYNPDNVSDVWIIENGEYIKFDLIEERFADMGMNEVETQYIQKKELLKGTVNSAIQAQIDLANNIETVANTVAERSVSSIKNIRETRKRERKISHVDCVMSGGIHD